MTLNLWQILCSMFGLWWHDRKYYWIKQTCNSRQASSTLTVLHLVHLPNLMTNEDKKGYINPVIHKPLAEVFNYCIFRDLLQEGHILHPTLLYIVRLPVVRLQKINLWAFVYPFLADNFSNKSLQHERYIRIKITK